MISDSKLYMWRTIFSLAHADGVVTREEINFMEEKLETLTLSLEQREILKSDMENVRDPQDMFLKISEPQDQADFFTIVRNLVMADGEYHHSEQAVVAKLQHLKVVKTDIDAIVGSVKLELEPEQQPPEEPKRGKRNFIKSLMRRKKRT